MKRKILFYSLLLGAGMNLHAKGISDNLALTPPMGWNSWNCFSCNIDEQQIRSIADLMVSTGMRDAGYVYLNIDDCWQVGRDAQGNIIVDPERFPSGMKALADYVHSKGLKFGVYSCAGSQTCAGRPGSKGYQFQDARTYAEWGVDYLKYDWCFADGQNAKAAYQTMREALDASGRAIVFSICEWGNNEPWKWGKGIGHLWRTTGDIINEFEGVNHWGGTGVVEIIDKNADLHPYAGPGHWNDPDMLQIGNGALTEEEARSHFSMWSMMAAPLLAGNDLRKMDKNTLSVLTNKEVIAVNQDSLGMQGRRYMKMTQHEIWVKPLSNGEVAVCFFNRADMPWEVDYNFEKKGFAFHDVRCWESKYSVRDLWQKRDIGTTNEDFHFKVEPHGVILLKLSKKQN